MTFARSINACHETIRASIGPEGCPTVSCDTCHRLVLPNVYRCVEEVSRTNLLGACTLAQAYAEWSGDYEIPVPFAIVSLNGILSKRIYGQSLGRLVASVRILRALNAPFTDKALLERPTTEMEHFLTDYVDVIRRSKPQVDENERVILNQLFEQLQGALDSKEFEENKFDLYFEKLVPYVQACRGESIVLEEEEQLDTNVVSQLVQQLKRSQTIREKFGNYNLPFDIFHVLAACYACCVDIDTVANWALDVMGRVCRGYYFWKRYDAWPLVKQVRRFLDREVTPTRNIELYYVVRAMRRGEGIECLSEKFKQYADLERMVTDKIRAPSHLHDMTCSQLFPAIVFDNHRDYMAFTISLGHVIRNLETGKGVRKGTFSKARKLYKTIVSLMEAVSRFEESDRNLLWTIDMLKLFLASDPTINKRLEEIASVVLVQSNEEEE